MLESGGKTYVMTCAHVISDGSRFVVTTNDGDEYDASVVGYDSQTDIGVLVINKTGFQIAKFADSDSNVVGEQVVAIGCPGGLEFMNSVSSGYVSALDRPIKSSIGYKNECIQTDAAINPGNSGGALFNMQGQVIGINSSKIAATEYEGIGFAVPSNTAIATANSLIKVGYVEGRAKIGINYVSLTKYSNANAILNALEKLGYEDAEGTMVISEISSESDLKNKDVQQYDMIVAINGETMTSTDILTSVLADSKPGDTVKLTIARVENNSIDTFEIDCKLIEAKG
jgi:serine protease Do